MRCDNKLIILNFELYKIMLIPKHFLTKLNRKLLGTNLSYLTFGFHFFITFLLYINYFTKIEISAI